MTLYPRERIHLEIDSRGGDANITEPIALTHKVLPPRQAVRRTLEGLTDMRPADDKPATWPVRITREEHRSLDRLGQRLGLDKAQMGRLCIWYFLRAAKDSAAVAEILKEFFLERLGNEKPGAEETAPGAKEGTQKRSGRLQQ